MCKVSALAKSARALFIDSGIFAPNVDSSQLPQHVAIPPADTLFLCCFSASFRFFIPFAMALRLGSKRVCAALRTTRPFTIAPVYAQRYASSAAAAASSLPNEVSWNL